MEPTLFWKALQAQGVCAARYAKSRTNGSATLYREVTALVSYLAHRA